ncbi:MAG TPA: PLD nuclease N-terminal domain-containing protein, partial [Ktedonobacterales bacterium]
MHLIIPHTALLGVLLVVLYVTGAAVAAVHALLTKPDPRSALGWIGVCWFFPLAGAVLYGLFGVNRVRTRARQLRAGLRSGSG